ncbi:Fic family protein [Robertkochia marina]|uniref:Fic family protein n=1 Tax=Robertkochia marina TaxID=1227945 RepID=A0A4S3LZ80_9FLAO|nr:Fic family protein [Robertkochia marina]THD67420.1 Fic family protein [Robertkochia marina]TRZ40811.1 Fic family protein [Robertkochia marina]
MKPPYDITPKVLELIASISQKIGRINASFLDKPSPQLRKENKVKTIHHSLKIEGNTLTEEQITALIENKKVLGPPRDINEVINAIDVYDRLNEFDFKSEESFLKAHRLLMNNLVSEAGSYRKQSVGIAKGSKLEHMAPPHENVPFLMKDLFNYIKDPNELTLIKSCVFHYELEFIHPFIDGNGRMGRLWQTLILMNEFPLFEFIPLETLISQNQKEYYKCLGLSDKIGKSTPFLEFMLSIIDQALMVLLEDSEKTMSQADRLEYFISKQKGKFTRKDYLLTFKNISSATASRDLALGVELNLLKKHGTKNKTYYTIEK